MEISDEERPLAQNGGAATGAQQKNVSWLKGRWTWLMLLGLAVAILAIAWVIKRPGGSTTAGGDRATASDLSPGSEVTLYLQGRSSVIVAADEKALDDLIGAMTSRGEEVQTLIQEGRAFSVPNNTRARVIEAAFAKLKVRIIEGDKIMFEVWVPERWVR